MKQVDSEKAIERLLVKLINQKGGLCIKLLTNQFIGLPDRLCLLPGGLLAFVELKTTGQKPKPIQIYVHNRLRSLGFRVEVIDTLQGIEDFVYELDGE